MLSWIGIEKGGVALKKKSAYDFARYSEPDKVHVPVPFPEKNYSVPWHFSSKFKSEIILKS